MPLSPILPSPVPAPPAALAERLAALAEGARSGQPQAADQLRGACQMLEAHFLTWLLREMRATVPRGGLLPYGPTEETYDELLDDALAGALARQGGLGLARAIEAQLRQGGPGPASATPASTRRDPAESR